MGTLPLNLALGDQHQQPQVRAKLCHPTSRAQKGFLVWCLTPRFGHLSHFPAEATSQQFILGVQLHRGQIRFGTRCYCPKGDGEKGKWDPGECCCSSKAHREPDAELLVPSRHCPSCSNPTLKPVWGYLAQKLHLPCK